MSNIAKYRDHCSFSLFAILPSFLLIEKPTMANTSAFNLLSPPTSTDTYPSPSSGRPCRLLTPRLLSPPSSTTARHNAHRKRRSNPKLPSRHKTRFDLSSDLEQELTGKKHMPSLCRSDNIQLSNCHLHAKSECYISAGKFPMDDDASVHDRKEDSSDKD